MAASASDQQLSPKVVAVGVVGVALTAITTAGAAITPELFQNIGPWGVVVFVLLTSFLSGLGAWWKSDPLRVNTLAQADAIADVKVRELIGSALKDLEVGTVVVNAPEPNGRHEAPAADAAAEKWPTGNAG